MLLRTFFLVLIASGLVGCASGKRGAAPQQASAQQRLIGRITSVNRSHGFVLIESVELRQPGAALVVMAPGEGSQAQLVVSREQRPPFLIADILSGSPLPGQRVVDAAAAPTPAPAPVSVAPLPPMSVEPPDGPALPAGAL